MYTLNSSDHLELILDVLSFSPLFFDFSLEELTDMLKDLDLVAFEDGEALTVQGASNQSSFILIDGRVSVSLDQADGSRLEVVEHGPPEIIGEMSLILNTPTSAHCRARGTALALRLSHKDFHAFMRQYPQFSLAICRIVVARMYRLMRLTTQLRIDASSPISQADLNAIFASSTGLTIHKTAQMLLQEPKGEAFQIYDLAQSLDAKSARDIWFDGDGKSYRTAADAIIIRLAALASSARRHERGEFGLVEAVTDDGQRLSVADYLAPHNTYLYPRYRLQTRPMPALTPADDVYKQLSMALVDTLAVDTYAALESMQTISSREPLRAVQDLHRLTNDFSVKFMQFRRLHQAESSRITPSRNKHLDAGNNPLLSIMIGIDTAVRVMVRLLRLVFDKFAVTVNRLPTDTEIETILVPNLRQSQQVLTTLAQVNLIDINTRNRVLAGQNGQWYDPNLFVYKPGVRAQSAAWDGEVTALHGYGLYPSPEAWQRFRETPPGRDIVRAVGGHMRTDGCPARVPLTLTEEAHQMGLAPANSLPVGGSGKVEANALLLIFHHLVVPLAAKVYSMDRQQRATYAGARQVSAKRQAAEALYSQARAQMIERLKQELEAGNPGLSKKAMARMLALRLKDEPITTA